MKWPFGLVTCCWLHDTIVLAFQTFIHFPVLLVILFHFLTSASKNVFSFIFVCRCRRKLKGKKNCLMLPIKWFPNLVRARRWLRFRNESILGQFNSSNNVPAKYCTFLPPGHKAGLLTTKKNQNLAKMML